MSKNNIFLCFLFVPIIILGLLIYNFNNYTQKYFENINTYDERNSFVSFEDYNFNIKKEKNLDKLIEDINAKKTIRNENFDNLITKTNNLKSKTSNLSQESLLTYDHIIEKNLGTKIDSIDNSNYKLSIFKIQNKNYEGYIGKLKLHNPDSLSLALANNTLGHAKATSQIAKDNNSIFAVNGGGFFYSPKHKKFFMIGKTYINGNLISNNSVNADGNFVAGIDSNGHLIGEKIPVDNENSNENSNKFKDAVTFIPILLKNKNKLDIPLPWKFAKHPRTVLGNLANEDLVFMVIDGRQANYSHGVSLESLQEDLLNYGLIDAYNLDGGGSSSFFYKNEVLNSPSDGNERSVPNAFILKK